MPRLLRVLGVGIASGLVATACSRAQVEYDGENGGAGASSGGGAASGAGAAGGAGAGTGAPGSGGPESSVGSFRFPDAGAGAGAGAAGGARGTGADPVKTCGIEQHKLQRVPPELVLVLDRSRTMSYPVTASPNNRWVEVTQALDVVLRHTERTVLWGLKWFPTTVGCAVTDPMEVPVATGNYRSMLTAMQGTSPNLGTGGTPMQLGLRKATAHLASRKTPNPKYLVLGTDGLPNCKDGDRMLGDTDGTIQAIRDALQAGFKTFVLGIAAHEQGASALGKMNMMAEAGGEARAADPKFYPVNNRDELVKTLNDITVRVSTCVFPLSKPPPNPNDVYVKVNGKKVDKDDMNGWSFGPNMQSIVLNGGACDQLKQTGTTVDLDVQIIFGCPGVYIP
jgi:hypothetical protein